jgi:D-alanyl-D-alanine carboxypeptidase
MLHALRVRKGVATCAVLVFAFVPAFASLSAPVIVDADHHPHRNRALTDPDQDAALAIDGSTGVVLFARNETAKRHPASLTKMMTLYLLFEHLRLGQLASSTELPISKNAAAQAQIKLHLTVGGTINIGAAIKALAVCSANDVAVVVAEGIKGTESGFVQMMNDKAREFGMTQTVFRNASGLPDDQQLTTARDLAILARHLVYDFPEYLPYFSMPAFTFGRRECTTHDALIGNYEGADGIKTGYTDASGYNIASTAIRRGTRVIAVVMGGLTAHKRDGAMVTLLDMAFEKLQPTPSRSTRVSAK